MICRYCEHTDVLSQSSCFLIQNVKERYIPTYDHTPIFAKSEPNNYRVRCTPTYHSNIFSSQHSHHVKPHKNNHKITPKGKIPTSTYYAHFKPTRNDTFYNSRGKTLYNRESQWYDHGKSQLLRTIDPRGSYSRERKQLDLASSQVFDGLVISESPCDHQICPKCQTLNPEEKQTNKIEKLIDQKLTQADTVTFGKKTQQKNNQLSKPNFTVIRSKK